MMNTPIAGSALIGGNQEGLKQYEPLRITFEAKGSDAELQYMAMLIDVMDHYSNALNRDEMRRAHDWFMSVTQDKE